MIWLWIVAALALLIGPLSYGLWQITRVSRGERIPTRTGAALLLIDLQTVFWDDGPYPAEARAIAEAAIQEAVRSAKVRGETVIALRQEWSQPMTRFIAKATMKGQALAGSPGTELAAPFTALPDHVLVKRVQDGFETGALDALLAQLDVGHLRLAGIDGNYCVARTAEAALVRGYAVTLVTSAILASDATRWHRTQERLAQLAASLP